MSDLPARIRAIVREEVDASVYWVAGSPVTAEEALSGDHHRRVCCVKHAIWWRLTTQPGANEKPPLSQSLVARMWGVDHTTVRHGVGRHADRMVEWARGKNRLYETNRRAHQLVAQA